MPHISTYNSADVRELMRNAPKVRSWDGLLKYMLDNDAHKSVHSQDALPGLIRAVQKMKKRGDAFTADPEKLWERINSRGSSGGRAGENRAPLRSKEIEQGYIDTNRGNRETGTVGPFPRKEPGSFDEGTSGKAAAEAPFGKGEFSNLPAAAPQEKKSKPGRKAAGRTAVPFPKESRSFAETHHLEEDLARHSSAVHEGPDNFQRKGFRARAVKAVKERPAAAGLIAAGVTGLAVAGALGARAVRRRRAA